MTPAPNSSARSAYPLALVLVLAALLRIVWWALYVGVIENEGVEYTRLAENWFHGRGYVSVFGGTHVLFPPFYPFLIGLVAPLAGSTEVAARLVSLAAGLVTIAAAFRLAEEVFGRRVAIWTGLTAACHPILVAFSVTTFSEVVFVMLATTGALAALRAVREPTALRAAWVGALCGLAYLTRPEGIALAVAFGGLVFLASLARGRRLAALVPAAALLAAAALVAAPYVVHLSRIAHGFRWEGKSVANDLIRIRQRQGMNWREAAYGLAPDGTAAGPFLFKDQYAQLARPPGEGRGVVEGLGGAGAGYVATLVKRAANARFLGAPPIVALALAGSALSLRSRAGLLAAAVLAVPPVLGVAVLLTLSFAWDRYFYALAPVFVVWAAAGAEGAGRAAAALLARATASERALRIARDGACALLLGLVVLVSARGITRVETINETRRVGAREAGARIRDDFHASAHRDARPRIASMGLALSHYAGGETVYLPYAEETLALRYLRSVHPDYVAVRRTESHMAPYAPRWLAEGLTDGCAREIVDLPPAAAAGYRIWRWTCGSEGGATSRLPPPTGSGAAPPRAAASSPGR